MSEAQIHSDAEEDAFAESDEWIAAQVRQLFRAHRAGDAKAVEVVLWHFEDYLTSILQRHLRLQDSAWKTLRWFDGFTAEPEYPSVGCLRFRGRISWVIGQQHWYYDPFAFEIELCPKSGAFRGYTFRFGDHRPLEIKAKGCPISAPPVGGWVYEIERRRVDAAQPADRLRE